LLQVANAKEAGAVGALMYLDPYSYSNTDTLVPFGHVSMRLAPLFVVLQHFSLWTADCSSPSAGLWLSFMPLCRCKLLGASET